MQRIVVLAPAVTTRQILAAACCKTTGSVARSAGTAA
jgi:hypothetical protein